MYKQKIGISVENNYSLPIGDVLQIIKNVGFEAISPAWESESQLTEIVHIAGVLGLELQQSYQIH